MISKSGKTMTDRELEQAVQECIAKAQELEQKQALAFKEGKPVDFHITNSLKYTTQQIRLWQKEQAKRLEKAQPKLQGLDL